MFVTLCSQSIYISFRMVYVRANVVSTKYKRQICITFCSFSANDSRLLHVRPWVWWQLSVRFTEHLRRFYPPTVGKVLWVSRPNCCHATLRKHDFRNFQDWFLGRKCRLPVSVLSTWGELRSFTWASSSFLIA